MDEEGDSWICYLIKLEPIMQLGCPKAALIYTKKVFIIIERIMRRCYLQL